ncbi:MAG: DUF805 domain-containing protein [Schwartzia sp. (in: firmicutes)]
MFCRKCGDEIPSDSLFCPKCGTHIRSVSQTKEIPPISAKTFSYKNHFLSLCKFSGTISRKAFVVNLLVVLAIQGILLFITFAAGGGLFSILSSLAICITIVPVLSLTIRRVRDTGCSLFLIPAFIILMVYLTVSTEYYSHKMLEFYRQAEVVKKVEPNIPRKAKDYWTKVMEADNNKRKEVRKLRKEAASYSKLCYNYRISAIALPLIFYGVFIVLPPLKDLRAE